MSEEEKTELETTEPATSLPTVNFCKNCHSDVSSLLYCPDCGQKTDTHVLTFRELLEELADGLFNMDSRLWRSLIPLALSPGKLTNEYLAGRRMYFLPPFRLYLILSVLFFLIPDTGTDFSDALNGDISQEGVDASLTGLEELPDIVTLEGLDGTQVTGAELAQQIRDDIARDLEEEGVDEEDLEDITNCEFSDLSQDSLMTQIFRDACLNFANNPDQLTDQMTDSIPIMMIVGIPLVALFMQLFYPVSRHYFVSHVIFLFHVHAFYFLISILMILSSWLGFYYARLFDVMDWFRIVAGFYIPIYIFQAMLKVYGDGKGKTFFKAFGLMIGYGVCVSLVMGFGFVFAALSL